MQTNKAVWPELAAYLLAHDGIIHVMVVNGGVRAYKESPTGGDWTLLTSYDEAKAFVKGMRVTQ